MVLYNILYPTFYHFFLKHVEIIRSQGWIRAQGIAYPRHSLNAFSELRPARTVELVEVNELIRESCSISAKEGPTDDLHPFTKGSESGLG